MKIDIELINGKIVGIYSSEPDVEVNICYLCAIAK